MSSLPLIGQRRVLTPSEWVQWLGLQIADIWPHLDRLRAEFVAQPRGFPAHWYLPFNATARTLETRMSAMLTSGMQIPRFQIAICNLYVALASWRVTQGIYRFDPTLYEALSATPVSGPLPVELLYRLPEWTVYIETPGMRWGGDPLLGAFAQIGEMEYGAEGLFLALHTKHNLDQYSLRLDQPTFEASLDIATRHTERDQFHPDPHDIRTVLPRILSLLLYLCSESAELGDGTTYPARPNPRRTRKGTRMFPADRLTTWDVGIRIGAALRSAYQRNGAEDGSSASHTGPRPHIRRAHWHTFLTGPRIEPRRTLRWLPPIAVNVDDFNDLVPTVRPVEARP
jgi:hypothetical protein